MLKFTIRRILIMIHQVILLSLIVFILAKFMPDDALTGEIDPSIDVDVIEKKREELGWNDPWYEQYGRWVAGVAKGDFGKSCRHKTAVTDLIGQRLINTFCLSLAGLIIKYDIAIS